MRISQVAAVFIGAVVLVPLALATPRVASASVKNPCALLSAAEASAALGSPVGKPQFSKGSDNVQCDYKAAAITATVMTQDGEKFCLAMSRGSEVKTFPRIAPKAAYVFNIGSMFVPKGGTCAVIGIESTTQDVSSSTKTVPASIVTIATKVAARL